MKKTILLAAALLAFAGCQEKPVDGPDKADEITVSPESKDFDGKGGAVNVIVTSSGAWSLDSKDGVEYDWVETDKISGEDGDIVKFTVGPNKEVLKTAEFVFVCGEATAPFKINSIPGNVPTIEVVSENPVEVPYTANEFLVQLSLSEDLDYRQIGCSIQQDGEWLSNSIPLEGDVANTAKMNFSCLQYDGVEPREAVITFSYEGAEPVTVNVRQLPQPVIKVEQTSVKLEVAGGPLEIPVIANVEYEISYSEGAEEWLTNYTVQENVHKWNCLAWEGEGLRKATISFTEKNPADTENPLKVSVVVSQSNFLIDVVADMDDHRAWIVDDAPNMDVFKLGQTLTLEALVKFQGDFYWDEDGQRVGAIAGIERRFLIRHSDAYGGAWELVYGLTRTNYNGEHYEGKVQSWKDLPENEWVHLAVTVGEGKIVLYQNGENVGEGDVPGDFKPVDFGEIYNAPNNGQTQRFSLGYAYEGNRDFDGLMSEVRIWNRALGEDEIKASNHFYSVPANSEGLVAYWKLDDGEGDIVKDYTSNGNNLKGYVKNGGPNNNPNWEEGMTWVEVGLPETRN